MKQQIKDLIQRVDALEHELALLCGRVKKIEEKIFPLWKINDEVNDNLVPLCRQSALAQTSEMQARLRFLSESSQLPKCFINISIPLRICLDFISSLVER